MGKIIGIDLGTSGTKTVLFDTKGKVIASKTIEYLASGSPTISVKNTKLMKFFKEEAIWARSSEPEDLCACLKLVLSLNKEERKILGKNAKEKALSLFSLKATNTRINNFLEGFKTRID